MNAPVTLAPVGVPLPSQFTSKVDKSDRRRLKVGADSYVHGNEEADTSNQASNQATVYTRQGRAQRLKTSR